MSAAIHPQYIDLSVVWDFGNAPTVEGDALVTTSELAAATTPWIGQPVVVASASNVNLGSPGGTVDGVTLSNGDRFWAMSQTTNTQNGVYIFNGSGSAATRSGDADAAAELRTGQVFLVASGTNAGAFVVITQGPTTLGSDPVSVVVRETLDNMVAGNGITKSGATVSASIGDGLEFNSSATRIKLDGSTVSRSNSGIKVSDQGIGRTQLDLTTVNQDGEGYANCAWTADGVITDFDLTSGASSTGAGITNAKLTDDHHSQVYVGRIRMWLTDDFTFSKTGGTGGVGRISFSVAPPDGSTVRIIVVRD